jgi:transcriptional regulator of acetoin/glycerol metabolism
MLLALAALREQAPGARLSTDAAEKLALVRWEGNARQLRHAMTHAVGRARARGEERILADDLPSLTPARDEPDQLTKERIQAALLNAGGVATRAAQALGISRTAFYNALKRLDIDPATLKGKQRSPS